MLCARYLVASEQMERSGPVAAAVRAVGYTSEEEEEDEEGSSVEEERDQDDDDMYEQAREEVGDESDAEPPEYASHREPAGYLVRTSRHGRASRIPI